MKKKMLMLTFLLLSIFVITGCSKYEKDNSYDVDLYGSYTKNIVATNTSYTLNELYTFNKDDTYEYKINEVIDGKTTKNMDKSGKLLSIKKMSDMMEITLDQEVIEFSTQENSNEIIYKYKNMIGTFEEVQIPDGKTFELHLQNVWFDEDGQYHTCTDTDICECNATLPQYIRKDNIIYFQSMDEAHKNTYSICYYIVDKGLFYPELYKQE